MKILVTIGSMAEKKFTRLFNIIDELCEEKFLDANKIIAQVGFDNYKSKYYQTFDMVSDEEFKNMIDESDLIISHAGTGTVTSCLKKNKKVIIFPRMESYDEHYDDHQLELCNLFLMKNYIMCAKDKQELKECISKVEEFTPAKFKSNNQEMNKLIVDFIELK